MSHNNVLGLKFLMLLLSSYFPEASNQYQFAVGPSRRPSHSTNMPLPEEQLKSLSENNIQVIIVGAGASGIAAATRLLENNVSNVMILEAEGRIGGRIHTVHTNEGVVELGAEWCNGEEGNVVYDMASRYGVLVPQPWPELYRMLYSNGEQFDEQFTSEVLGFMFGTDDMSSQEISEEERKESIGEFIRHRYEETILKKYQHDQKKLKFAMEAIPTLESYELTDTGAANWNTYGPVKNQKIIEGCQTMIWKGVGFDTILQIMMRTYKSNTDVLGIRSKIWLQKRVTRIDWLQKESDKVRVRCEDNHFYTADHVIFTPSLGVLKKDHEKLFHPGLSLQKKEGISKLGYGGLVKIICIFRSKWWTESKRFKALVWTSEDRLSMPRQFPKGPVKDGQSWLTHVQVIHYAENHPNAIVAWLTGDMTLEVEQTSIQIIEEGMMYIFKKFLGNTQNITKPVRILRHRSAAYLLADMDITVSPLWKLISMPKEIQRRTNGQASYTKQFFMFDGQSWLTHVQVIHYAENHPNAIVAWLTGDMTLEVEQTSIQIIEEGMMYIFKKFLGNTQNITKPVRILRTRWCTNHNFRGTFSFETLVSTRTDTDWNLVLSEPLVNSSGSPLVFFAGEATSTDYYSTVHGAIESGYKEAERLLNVLRNK